MSRLVCLLVGWLSVFPVLADSPCRVAFDVGSSGVRVGSDSGRATQKMDIDYLSDLWADQVLDTSLPDTVRAFIELPARAGFAADCVRVAGGFSAWRLALQVEGRERLAATLAKLHGDSGVPLLVVPQRQEGRYGYLAARKGLGDGLRTSHILDIGGGSLQVAGAENGWGRMLGQKAWHKLLCEKLRPGVPLPCALPQLSADELAEARLLADQQLTELGTIFVAPLSITAISRPVTRGLYPAIRRLQETGRLNAGAGDENGLSRQGLSQAIRHLAPLASEERASDLAISEKYGAYLVSDMLLVEGILRATAALRLEVSELDLNNIPGLLADERAYAWAANYACYLDRLRSQGEAAYEADPARCD